MRILVTGASGFLGRPLVSALTERGHEVAATYIEDDPPDLDIELHRADLFDHEALGAAVERSRPDRVVHMAGLSHVGSSFGRADAYHRVNALGTRNVVAAAGEAAVVLASSSEVYGPVPESEQPIDEAQAAAPGSPYAESKVASEESVLAARGVVVRCFNVVGPGQLPTFALPAFAAQLAEIERGEREPVLEVGNLEVWRDFVPLGDAVEGYVVVVERGERGTIYNLGTGRPSALSELVRQLIDVSGLDVEIRVDPARCRPVDARMLYADSSRLRALGWRPGGDLAGVLRQLWEEARTRAGAAAESA